MSRHKWHAIINYTYEADYEEDCPPGCKDSHIDVVQDIFETYDPISHSIVVPKGLGHWTRTSYDIQVDEI